MQSFMFALATMVGYAVFNVIADRNFSKMSALSVNAACAVGYAFFSVIAWLIGKAAIRDKLQLPVGDEWIQTLVVGGFILFASEFSYFCAYSSGGKLIVITTSLMLVPLMASGMKSFLDRSVPDRLELLAWLLGAVAVILMAIVQAKKDLPQPPP